MRSIAIAVFISCACISTAQASTLTARLVVTADDVVKGLFHAAIQVQSAATTDGSQGDGGLSGARFDIISRGHNISQAVPAEASGPNFGNVLATWDSSITGGGFVLLAPQKLDATQAMVPGDPLYVSDGDFDALGATFSDPTASGTHKQIGFNLTGSNWQTIITESFQVVPGNTDNLDLNVIGPTYYDFSAINSNFQRPYTRININQGIPEPTTLTLLALGAIGLIAHRRYFTRRMAPTHSTSLATV